MAGDSGARISSQPWVILGRRIISSMMRNFSINIIKPLRVLGVASALLGIGPGSLAAPEAELWERWSAFDGSSTQSIDHSAWTSFLEEHVVESGGINLLRYAAVSDSSLSDLRSYLETLQETEVSTLSRDEQRAYWVNLYNAKTVEIIVANYPVESIRDISGSLFSPGPWDDEVLTVEGEPLTLNDIEHRILRPIWKDPRIHYAVNCASIGCPNLAIEAFTADNTEDLLDAGAIAYVNHPRGVMFEDGELVVSSIYLWFMVDFGDDDSKVIDHLSKYAKDELKGMLSGASAIGADQYDWSLNGAP